jgi:hypothetical protein
MFEAREEDMEEDMLPDFSKNYKIITEMTVTP